MKRIKETRHKPTGIGGMITDSTPTESRVVDVDDNAVLMWNQQEVSADTPLSDWTEDAK